ncbi:MAG: GNAT family N-acetyltransferase [Lachnospiraceae bacterium]|nr:GNAT family N-acetyltransferase [Lachnospiraceae bacterium]
MLEFEPFSVPALQRVLPLIKNNPSLCNDLSAGSLFMWHEGAEIRFCVYKDTFAVSQIIGEQLSFSYPFGAEPDAMIDQIMAYMRRKNLPVRFFAVDEETLEKIRNDKRFDPCMYAYDRRWSDYVYSFEEAMTFKGKKYNGQRNHINKFKKLYGEPQIRFLKEEDYPEAINLLNEYEEEHRDGFALEKLEIERTKELLKVYEKLGLYAAGLFTDGRLAAVSIGEVMGDMLLIHVEKALTRYEGIYPTMYSGFVRLICEHLGHPLRYVNREDDSGDQGLRTSKMQYHPELMAHKYLVHVNTPALKMPADAVVFGDGVVLTEFRETDKKAYMELNTDIENNKYWGYDYSEDLSIAYPVDENTFYDSVVYDTKAGDSINFAVRLSEDGEMIGEAVLWKFSSDGTAELGCRILKEHHGKGLGKAAFQSALEFGEKKLGLKVVARCYRENIPSFRMITASGLEPVKEDDTYFYFERS